MTPTLLKTLHVLGAVLFLGNIIVTAFWKTLADRTGNLAVIRFSVRATNLADLLFTLTGAVLLAASGHALASPLGGIGSSGWLRLAYGLFMITALLWLLVLIPVQWRQARLLGPLAPDASVPAAYHRLARIWAIAGTLATLLPLVAAGLMVTRPF